ncbi:hypothetical protein [Arenimonas oryziterrae]|uniref:Uncharacterized protein n=1 Tax=Arenimonas oryziterrae DSM 21050 = YC6267 TaxID=1121015 RepID=A0A091ASR8_9GAMM|nr:hypothetical protein [Arenimonas oryziterrae]KFN42207.1 hypothetical protein N789_14565 [Arenimonas oryziterrae DSM 21050 = YC6267]
MALKHGRVADFADSLAEAMEKAMKTEWAATKGFALPDQGVEDRRLLFVAVAWGLFDFLKANENALINEITLHDASGLGSDIDYDVVQLELNL